jgi:hypothetical protein
MPYKNIADRTAQSRRWRLDHPERDAKFRKASTLKQTAKRNSGVVRANTLKGRENKAILIEYKGGCCVDCGGMFPACCYDFDHLRDKVFEIASCLCCRIEKLKAEADKCDLVCANCHRVRTQKRQGVPLGIS